MSAKQINITANNSYLCVHHIAWQSLAGHIRPTGISPSVRQKKVRSRNRHIGPACRWSISRGNRSDSRRKFRESEAASQGCGLQILISDDNINLTHSMRRGGRCDRRRIDHSHVCCGSASQRYGRSSVESCSSDGDRVASSQFGAGRGNRSCPEGRRRIKSVAVGQSRALSVIICHHHISVPHSVSGSGGGNGRRVGKIDIGRWCAADGDVGLIRCNRGPVCQPGFIKNVGTVVYQRRTINNICRTCDITAKQVSIIINNRNTAIGKNTR